MRQVLKDHFIPHTGNNYRPYILQRMAMAAMLGLVLISFALANAQAVLWLNVDRLVSAVLPAVVVEETNEERTDGAMQPLRRNSKLDRAAQLKADHMAEVGYFAHYAPDGTSPWYWFQSTNYKFAYAGENLAVHFNDSREVVRAWMKSPTHRANIMNNNFTEIGIGVAEAEFEGYDTVFVVQMFGTPAQTTGLLVSSDDTSPVVSEQVLEPDVNEPSSVAAAEGTTIAAPLPPAPSSNSTKEAEPTEETLVSQSSSTPVYELPNTDEESEESVTPTSTLASTPPPIAEQFISTSTNAVPARIDTTTAPNNAVSVWGRLATSPQLVLQSLYMLIALFIIIALSITLVVAFRRHQFVHVAYSVSLLFVMGGLFYLQSLVTAGATIL